MSRRQIIIWIVIPQCITIHLHGYIRPILCLINVYHVLSLYYYFFELDQNIYYTELSLRHLHLCKLLPILLHNIKLMPKMLDEMRKFIKD